jgi:preprotein translocase subunit SecE
LLQVQVLSPLPGKNFRHPAVHERGRLDGTTGGTVATDTRDAAPAPAPSAGGRGARVPRDRNQRISPRQYYREIVSELRKVIYPSRNELITYVLVVLIFVSVMTALVASLDYGFTQAVIRIFG